MHRNKDVILGEDGYTNRCDNAPRNIFSLTGFVLGGSVCLGCGLTVRVSRVVTLGPSVFKCGIVQGASSDATCSHLGPSFSRSIRLHRSFDDHQSRNKART